MLDQVAAYVRNYYDSFFPEALCYHDITHTERVVQAATILCDQHELSENSRFLVLAAAWFHDSGYHHGAIDHESAGVKIARTYFEAFPEVDVDKICQLIMATSIDTEPTNLEEEIIRDSDLHYLGQTTYFGHADLLKEEWEHAWSRKLTKVEWYQINIAFFEKHRFYTEFAQRTYGPAKRQNLQSIKNRLQHELARDTDA